MPPLGAYDLAEPEVLAEQARLAAEHGIDGFLVYHYWFDGRRVLDRPMTALLERPELDVPYALVWANENWTRAWDGSEDEVLLRQGYEPGWPAGLVDGLAAHLADSRYLRLDGVPLLVLFKPSQIPDLRGAVAQMRDRARALGLGELHVAGVLHDRHVAEPDFEALDSWIEFPPLSGPTPRRSAGHPESDRGTVYDYRDLVDQAHHRPVAGARRVHPGVMPSWDNTPRRTAGASAFAGANPADFRRWLVEVRRRLAGSSPSGEMLIAVNAWNEWAETAYLEPDALLGSAYLEAVRSAVGVDT